MFSFISIAFQNNGPVLFTRRNCFPLSVATDDKDWHWPKLEKDGQTFSSFNAMLAKTTKKIILSLVWDLLKNATEGFNWLLGWWYSASQMINS